MNDKMIRIPYAEEILPVIKNANEHHMAVLFLLDTSFSMAGKPIEELNLGLQRFKEQVCLDPITREVLDVAVVEFNSVACVVQPFVPVDCMEPMNLQASGDTNMEAGLNLAMNMVDQRYRFYKQMGTVPYCPWIIMLTDGFPNDTSFIDEMASNILSQDRNDKMRFWSMAVSGANTALLNRLGHGERVLSIKDYNFTSFFDWLHKSFRKVSSSAVGDIIRLDPLPENVLTAKV